MVLLPGCLFFTAIIFIKFSLNFYNLSPISEVFNPEKTLKSIFKGYGNCIACSKFFKELVFFKVYNYCRCNFRRFLCLNINKVCQKIDTGVAKGHSLAMSGQWDRFLQVFIIQILSYMFYI